MSAGKNSLATRAEALWPIGWENGWAAGIASASVCGVFVEIGATADGQYRGRMFDHPNVEDSSLWGMLCQLRSDVLSWRSTTVTAPLPEMVEPNFIERKTTVWGLITACLPQNTWGYSNGKAADFSAVRQLDRALDVYYTLILDLEGGALRLRLMVNTTGKQRTHGWIPLAHTDSLAQVRNKLHNLFLSLAGLTPLLRTEKMASDE
jgi:hypothetical protein